MDNKKQNSFRRAICQAELKKHQAQQDEIENLDGNFSNKNAVPRKSYDEMYQQGENFYSNICDGLIEGGWSVFPQEREGKRMPGIVRGDRIKWGALRDKPLEGRYLEETKIHCGRLNVAVAFGPASGNTFALDIDIEDEVFAQKVEDLADEIIGYTPIKRIGNAPKIALIYKNDLNDPVRNTSLHFKSHEYLGQPLPITDGVEILSTGKSLSLFGLHHFTQRYFKYPDKTPIGTPSSEVPVASNTKVQLWLEAINDLREFNRGASIENKTPTICNWDSETDLHIPEIQINQVEWVEDENGIVIDGREAFLRQLVWRMVTSNHTADKNVLIEAVYGQFESTALMDHKWNSNKLRNDIRYKTDRLLAQIESGEVKPWTPDVLDAIEHDDIENDDIEEDGIESSSRKTGLSSFNNGYSDEFSHKSAEELHYEKISKASPTTWLKETNLKHNSDTNDLLPNLLFRKKIQMEKLDEKHTKNTGFDLEKNVKTIKEGLDKYYNEYLDIVYDENAHKKSMIIVKAPPGAGKTTYLLEIIAKDYRTFENCTIINKNGEKVQGKNPFLMLISTYNNIDEIRTRAKNLNIDDDCDDKELIRRAEEAGLCHIDDVVKKIDEIRRNCQNTNIKFMTYKGKIRAGCQRKEEMELVTETGISSSGLCHTTSNGNKEESFCEFYNECPAIKQLQEIQNVDIVFMAHPFLNLTIPKELENSRGIIVDEKFYNLFLHDTVINNLTLLSSRAEPTLTKEETAAGVVPLDLLEDREILNKIFCKAIKEKKDHVLELLDHIKLEEDEKIVKRKVEENLAILNGETSKEDIPLNKDENTLKSTEVETPEKDLVKGKYNQNVINIARRMIESSIKVNSSGISRNNNLYPEMSLEELQEICRRPEGEQILPEYRFAKTSLDRLENIISGDDKGKTDIRFQWRYVFDEKKKRIIREEIRVAWRTEPNWLHTPYLTLDASANPAIYQKIFGEETKISVRKIDATMNIKTVLVGGRTNSNSSFTGFKTGNLANKYDAAKQLEKVRRATGIISSYYSNGRVLFGTTKTLREVINTSWEMGTNIDQVHFGALRGLDQFKDHDAAVSLGRLEPPAHVIDSQCAALSYDDDIPELPFDSNGTGMGDNGSFLYQPRKLQKVYMRNGDIYTILVPAYPGKWHKALQEQNREEELLQFYGRLRTIYRKGPPPTYYCMSSIIPEDIIVDDIITLEDLSDGGSKIAEASRLCGGIIETRIIAKKCSDLYSNQESVARVIKEAGFDDLTGETNTESANGFTCYKWREIGSLGRPNNVFAMNSLDDPIDKIRKLVTSTLRTGEIQIWKHDGVIPKKKRTNAKERLPDNVDEIIGTREERRIAETILAEAVAETVYSLKYKVVGPPESSDGTRQKPHVFEEIKKLEGRYTYNLLELQAFRSNEIFWAKREEEADVDNDILDNDNLKTSIKIEDSSKEVLKKYVQPPPEEYEIAY